MFCIICSLYMDNGIDLNRNFPVCFDLDKEGSSPDVCSEIYRVPTNRILVKRRDRSPFPSPKPKPFLPFFACFLSRPRWLFRSTHMDGPFFIPSLANPLLPLSIPPFSTCSNTAHDRFFRTFHTNTPQDRRGKSRVCTR